MPASKTPAKPKAAPAGKARSAPAEVQSAAPPSSGPQEPEARVKSAALKIRDLLARVGEQSDAPKKIQRELSEAVLAVLGAALAAGEELNLPGLGRLKVVRTAEKAGAAVLTVKVRPPGQKNSASGKEPLADAAEDG